MKRGERGEKREERGERGERGKKREERDLNTERFITSSSSLSLRLQIVRHLKGRQIDPRREDYQRIFVDVEMSQSSTHSEGEGLLIERLHREHVSDFYTIFLKEIFA